MKHFILRTSPRSHPLHPSHPSLHSFASSLSRMTFHSGHAIAFFSLLATVCLVGSQTTPAALQESWSCVPTRNLKFCSMVSEACASGERGIYGAKNGSANCFGVRHCISCPQHFQVNYNAACNSKDPQQISCNDTFEPPPCPPLQPLPPNHSTLSKTFTCL